MKLSYKVISTVAPMEYVLNMLVSLLLYHYYSLDLSFITCQKKPGLDQEF